MLMGISQMKIQLYKKDNMGEFESLFANKIFQEYYYLLEFSGKFLFNVASVYYNVKSEII